MAYYQQGVSNFLVGDFEEALANFNDTLLYLRGNTYIDYEQLGLKFKLFSCEVLFNRGLCYIYLQQKQTGLQDLCYASKEKVNPDHEVIDEAIREEADVRPTWYKPLRPLTHFQGYTVFSIPVGVVYRPNSSKVKNLKTKDYLGKARLIASADKGNLHTGFSGSERRAVINADTSRDDRPPEGISFAASNLVRSDLTSRNRREQSAPPINRNVFPPTPPPESEKEHPPRSGLRNASATPAGPSGMTARAHSVRDGAGLRVEPHKPRRPTELQLSPKSSAPGQASSPWGTASPHGGPLSADTARPRLGTTRTASEPRGPASRYNHTRPDRRERDIGPPSSGGRRLFMETTPLAEGDEGTDEALYDLYKSTASSNPYGAPPPGAAARRIASSGTGHGRLHSLDESPSDVIDDFEMLHNAGGSLSTRDAGRGGHYGGLGAGPSPPPKSNGGGVYGSLHGSASAGGPDVRTCRVKVRHGDDTRYLMVATTLAFDGFRERVREKLGVQGRFKITMMDEGDMITVGDPEDWDMALVSARKEAKKSDEEMARMEVCSSLAVRLRTS